MNRTNELTLLPKLPLLITESPDEFDEQRQLRQKCQFVCSIHLLTPINLLSRAPPCCANQCSHCRRDSYRSRWLVWRKWRRTAADSAVRLPRRDRNGGL